MTNAKRALTGIKPTGKPHLGNFFGAIQPALALMQEFQCYFFVADYHALTTVKDADQLRQDTLEIAAAWLACGLDPEQHYFYRQSDLPELCELSWILSCQASKGLLNRAHAYKTLVDQNIEQNVDPDKNVNMGIFQYPVLMAADILAFDCHVVPVGLDQKQHVEIARDIAESFNHHYGETFVVPEPMIQESVQTIPGVDGRKMSKNYDNTLPLFSDAKSLRKKVMQIVTDSKELDEVKDPSTCNVVALYRLVASDEQVAQMEANYRAGSYGYGHAKQALFEQLEHYFQEAQHKYNTLMEDTSRIEDLLAKGAEKVRPILEQKMASVRRAIGLR